MKTGSTLGVQSEKPPAYADRSQGETPNESTPSEATVPGGGIECRAVPAGEKRQGPEKILRQKEG